MWKFANPIRHKIEATRWPTADQAARSLLYSPVKIGRHEAKSRTWVPAMVPWRATEDGFVTQQNLDWYARFADGRPAVLVVEATGVRDIPSGPLLRIGDDRFIPGLRKLVDVVKEVAAKLGNKPATCKKYYIHPNILDCYESGRLLKIAKAFRHNHHGYDYEGLVLSLLPALKKLRAAA